MRYRNLWKNVDPAARWTFQIAALANDPQQKLVLLEPLTTVEALPVRARALLVLIRQLNQPRQSEYTAWCSGLLVIAQPAHPALLQINPAGGHGLWTLAILLAMIGCLAQSQRSYSPLVWIGGALAIPMGAGIAVVA